VLKKMGAIFEQHGFVWGGKWRHHDTMHFEYRPELIAVAKASAKP
jgi:D-alanyl-D-alanine carboxypeptidase